MIEYILFFLCSSELFKTSNNNFLYFIMNNNNNNNNNNFIQQNDFYNINFILYDNNQFSLTHNQIIKNKLYYMIREIKDNITELEFNNILKSISNINN